MRRKLSVIGGVAALLTTALVVGILVPAASQQPTTQTIVVCDPDEGPNAGFSREIDVGKNGFSSGDYVVFTDKWYNPATGARRGRDAGRFTFIRPLGKRNGVFYIDATGIFKTGKIMVSGAATFAKIEGKGAKFAVTGGTGAYREAEGTLIAKSGRCRGNPGVLLTFRLIFD